MEKKPRLHDTTRDESKLVSILSESLCNCYLLINWLMCRSNAYRKTDRLISIWSLSSIFDFLFFFFTFICLYIIFFLPSFLTYLHSFFVLSFLPSSLHADHVRKKLKTDNSSSDLQLEEDRPMIFIQSVVDEVSHSTMGRLKWRI